MRPAAKVLMAIVGLSVACQFHTDAEIPYDVASGRLLTREESRWALSGTGCRGTGERAAVRTSAAVKRPRVAIYFSPSILSRRVTRSAPRGAGFLAVAWWTRVQGRPSAYTDGGLGRLLQQSRCFFSCPRLLLGKRTRNSR